MNPLLTKTYSSYAQRLIDSGNISIDAIHELVSQLPLSKTAIDHLIKSHLPNHHDAEHSAGVALRRARASIMLALMEYDLNNAPTQASLNVITQTISAFADTAVLHAMSVVRAQVASVHGEPFNFNNEPMPLWVMGMGKLSGHELNVSSDIDLIFVFEHEGETRAADGISKVRSISHSEFFDKVGRRLIKLLDDVTEHGFVFRVDMRLRPNGSSGALCVSLA